MAIFRYKATDADKKRIEGLVEANSEYEAGEIISEKNLSVISIKKEGGFKKEIKILSLLNKIKKKDLVIFFRQFSVLVSASVDLVQSLRILVEQTDNIRLKIIVSEIADEVDSGSRLSDSFSKRSDVFSNFHINVIKSGETSGKLDEVMNYLAEEIEKDYDMISKIKGAMMYPAFLFTGLIVVGSVMMVMVIPKLTLILTESGADLPFTTKILIATSDFFVGYWWLLFLIFGALIMGVYFFAKTKIGKRNLDLLILKLPIFGGLWRRIYVTRFTRTMYTLISGGVTINQSLIISAEVIGNQVYRDLILRTSKAVEDGNSMSSVFVNDENMPKMVAQIISVGEKTGKLDTILQKISDFYTKEINNITANLMVLLEPIVLVLMGVAVGIMVAGIILPMYNLASGY